MSNKIRAIRSETDYNAALARIDALMDADAGSAEGEELDVLVDLVELYEEKHVPMGYPTPIEAIRFRMEQDGLSPRDLIPFIGSRSKVSEVLSGKRPLTMQMARALHANLGIPADVLLQQPGGELPSALDGIEWDRFPVVEMAKLVVMVSHDLAAIAKYCSRVVWVDHGQVRLDGDPSTVITSYMESAQRPNNAAA